MGHESSRHQALAGTTVEPHNGRNVFVASELRTARVGDGERKEERWREREYACGGHAPPLLPLVDRPSLATTIGFGGRAGTFLGGDGASAIAREAARIFTKLCKFDNDSVSKNLTQLYTPSNEYASITYPNRQI